MINNSCCICERQATIETIRRDSQAVGVAKISMDISNSLVSCDVCGKYYIGLRTPAIIQNKSKNERSKLSGILREASDRGIFTTITAENIDEKLSSASIPDNAIEKIDKILLYINKKAPTDAKGIVIIADKDYPIAYAKDNIEFSFYLHKAVELEYLEDCKSGRFRLNLEGWKRLGKLIINQPKADKAFVAMWFDGNMKSDYEKGIKPALIEAGYKPPFRVDDTPHNEKTDEKIIKEIKKSSLLVADFTGNRSGVYFEAGLAMGLGIPIIWSCKDEEKHRDKLHFDTNHYNHILWKDTEDLKNQLRNMIVFNLNRSNK
jgi:hypothetical protein